MKLGTFIRTVRYLRFSQIMHRLWWPFRRVRVGTVSNPALATPVGRWVESIPSNSEVENDNRFALLNQIIEIGGKESWNDSNRDKLLLYHLHYHELLNCQRNFSNGEAATRFINRWIDDNPPTGGNGWEPYPISLRIVNWIKWVLAGNALSEKALTSLWLQARVLAQTIEYHVLANHLFENAKALFFAGVFFEGDEADQWLAKGRELLDAAVEEQVLDDGGHIERSPMYQATILEDLLDIVNICHVYSLEPPRGTAAAAASMLHWLSYMTHPDGQPAYFNDTTRGVAPSLVELQEYADRLGIQAETTVPQGLSQLPDSGYLRYQREDVTAFVDAGEIGPDYQPGHAHCDCLSFELSIGTKRIFVNTGVSTYNANERRHLERGTESHNTVSVDGEEQSEIWGAFRVGRRARPVDVDVGESHVSAAHDGYQRLGILHRRRFDFLADGIEIKDALESDSPSIGVAHFHCHPGLDPLVSSTDIEIAGLRLSLENAENIEVLPYEFCEGFNFRRPGKKIAVTFESTLTTCIYYEDSLHNG